MKVSSPRQPDDEWMVGTLQQQLTCGSQVSGMSEVTVATTVDQYKNGLQHPLLGGYDSTQHWPRHSKSTASKIPLVVVVPAVLVSGIMIGFTLACLLLPAMISGHMAGDIQVQGEPYQLVSPPTDVPEAYYAAAPFNNANLIPNLPSIPAAAGKPQTFDACGFVVRSTDDVWNKRENVNAAIDKYFHEDYVDAGSWGTRIIGKEALKRAVWNEMRAFPDIQIHITDCLCLGNDVDGYKCAMPDVLTGTNSGPSGYGPATGNRAKWTGMVESFVKQNPSTGQWQYYAEWGMHDEWALVQQLGLDFSRVPHPNMNSEPLHDGTPFVSFSGGQLSIDNDDVMRQRLHDAEKY